MRILQIISHYVPAYRFGGPLRVAHALGKAMVHHGHQVVVCTTNLADEQENLDVLIDEPVEVDGVQVYYEPTILSRYWGFSPALWRRIKIEIKQTDLVLIHAHYQFANFIGAYLARHYRKPYIIFAHGSLHNQGIHLKNRWSKQIYLWLLEQRNLEQALFIAFNAIEEQKFSLFQNLGEVVPSGIDPVEFTDMPAQGSFRQKYLIPQNKKILLFLGRLDINQKGIDLLIPAFAKTMQAVSNVHLVIAGPDENGGAVHIRQLIHSYKLTEHVTLTGLIVGQNKLAALQDADIFVLPSRFEGLSIALLEALYIGLPVLVTDQIGLFTEIARLNAGIVVSPTIESISGGITKLCDSSLHLIMRNKARKFIAEQYTWNAIAENFLRKTHLLSIGEKCTYTSGKVK